MKIKTDSHTFNYSDVFFCYHSNQTQCFNKQINFHSIIYVYSGEILLEEGNKKTLISKGQCIFLRRNHKVSMTKRPTKQGEDFKGIFMVLSRDFLREYYRSIKKNTTNRKKLTPSIVPLSDNTIINSLFLSIQPYFDTSIQPLQEIIKMKQEEAILALLSHSEEFYPTLFDFTDPWKIDIMDFMEKNYMHDFSLEEIANFTGRSVATFKRDFSKMHSVSPHRWLIRKRLEEAKKMINEKNKAVSDVYTEVGFKNLSHFSTAYKKEFGFAPTKYC